MATAALRAGAKGDRVYAWALLVPDPPVGTEAEGRWWLLISCHPRCGGLAFYRCYTPTPAPLRVLVVIAGRRWRVEKSFQAGKGLADLDEHQLHRWQPWRRWTIFAMLADALLAVTTAELTRIPPPDGLITLTCNESPPVTFLIIPSRGSRSPGPVWLLPPVVRMIRGVLSPGRVASTDR